MPLPTRQRRQPRAFLSLLVRQLGASLLLDLIQRQIDGALQVIATILIRRAHIHEVGTLRHQTRRIDEVS